MLTHKVQYVDFKGNKREEEVNFNLTKSELLMLEMTTPGGFANQLQSVASSNDGGQIMTLFETLLLKSYGMIVEDGKRFAKSEEISRAFSQTAAFDQIFMDLCTKPELAASFIKGIIPEEASAG